jgi:hypothetical protein
MKLDDKFLKDVIKWHKKTMPHATLATQLIKLEEELAELGEASKAAATKSSSDNLELANMEIADVLLCCLVLERRFGSLVGPFVCNNILEDMPDVMRGSVFTLARLKFEINKSRKWAEVEPGVYRHEDNND